MSRHLIDLCVAAAIFLALPAVHPGLGEASGSSPAAGGEVAPLEVEIMFSRDLFIQEVLERNRLLEQAHQAWQEVAQREFQAGALDDPSITYTLAPRSIGSSDSRYGQVLRVGQRLPYPGKLHQARIGARAEADAARLGVEALRLELAALASHLFDEYYFVHRALAINAEHIALLSDFQRIAIAQYKVGLASQQDPLQAEVGLANLLHRTVILETRRRNLRAQINALQHQPPEAPLPPPPASLPPPPIADVAASEAQREALAKRPELGAAAAEIRARQAELARRKLDFRPDFETMASFNSLWNESDHRWTVGAGISLPIRRRRVRAAVAESTARLAGAMAGREALEDAVRSEVQQAYDRLEEAAHVLTIYEDRLLPATTDQIQAALAGFKTSRNSFLALIEAERNQRSVRLARERALADAWQRRAELDRLMGHLPGDLPTADAASKGKDLQFGGESGESE